MGERKGVNKYYPPDYDPSKGGLNKFLGSHALRERARKLHLGILIIRFELPYNIWCEGCKKHIGMGVRYNAEKKKVGMYYSTPIYQFRMKCHLCDNHFEIKTDPANLDYVIVSGAKRQENRWDPADNEQVVTEDKNIIRKMTTDAMYRLEHGVEDTNKLKDLKNTIENLEDLQNSRWKDDYAANGALRERLRASRNEVNQLKIRNSKLNLNIPLLPPSQEDDKIASILQLSQVTKNYKTSEERQSEIKNESVFSKTKSSEKSLLAKKDIARRAINSILSTNQKSFTAFTNDNHQLTLGIKKKEKNQVEGESRNVTINDGIKPPDTSHAKESCCAEEAGPNKTGIVAYDSSESD